MTPTDKSPQIEEAIASLMGVNRRTVIQSDRCAPPPWGCGGPATSFTDGLSIREYRISGLCQTCQDKVFGGHPHPHE